jgi:serine/threonine-protein kinase
MGTAVGTLEYMAPEQLMGGAADGRTDIYTLGVVAYELITGRRPFDAVGLDLLTQQLSDPPPAPSTLADVPATVDRVLLRCLAWDPAERFADVHELARALDDALAGPPPPQHAPAHHAVAQHGAASPVPRTATPMARERPITTRAPTQGARPSLVLLAISLVLLLAGVGLAVAYFSPSE